MIEEENHSFEFTTMGIKPMGTKVPGNVGDLHGARTDFPKPEMVEVKAPVVAAAPQQIAKQVQSISPKDVIRLAKARQKELRAEIRRLKNLQKELAQIERLLAAANAPPKPVVRSLPNRSA